MAPPVGTLTCEGTLIDGALDYICTGALGDDWLRLVLIMVTVGFFLAGMAIGAMAWK